MLGTMVSSGHYTELLESGRKAAAPMLEIAPAALAENYNCRPFRFTHRLADNAHFSVPRLFDLCRRMDPEQIQFRIGEIPGNAHFDNSFRDYRRDLGLDDVIEHFEERRAYICIYNPERDPEYRPLIESLIGEIAARVAPYDPLITWYSTYVFLSTRNSVTPYHMDREMNFLLQIRGSKRVQLWDQDDPIVMSDAQKDFLLSHIGDRPPFTDALEDKAQSFELESGEGVHHPFIAPHRVYTDSELSVTLALTYRTRQSDIWTDAHRFNAKLRRIGWRPLAVGRRQGVDTAKSRTLRLIRHLRTVI